MSAKRSQLLRSRKSFLNLGMKVNKEILDKTRAVGGWDRIISQNFSVGEEEGGAILMKEEIKEEDLEDQSSLTDITIQTGLENCLQTKIKCLPSNIEIDCSRSNSPTLLSGASGKLKNLCRTKNGQIGTCNRDKRTHTGEKPFKCTFCPYQGACKRYLKKHEKTHLGERPFKCRFCSYQAAQIGHLKRHERTHTGKRPFQCSSCIYQATRLDNLKKHERTHSGERPFKCSYCPYQASQLATLKAHKRTHTGERPFKCSLCSYRATQICALKEHEKIHTGKKPFKCSSCSYEATQLGNLKRHEKTHG